ncbi:T9SS type B sorting domain-containing protein [Flavobacterium gilvum]|nr:T9SS type B sorting domain-containing protein [Flavobacterium gilvum]KFC60064.1 hypothetical protein FEM08_11380 [Flavobacterium gilvum]
MKKPTFSKAVCAVLFLFLALTSVGQTLKPFTVRKKVDLKGKMLVIGNNILGKDNNPFNDDTKSNEDISMQYIDIDGDASTFSSSSADLVVPNQKNGSPTTCYRITYAALYWGAMLKSTDGSRANINTVKLKLPGATTYNNINGTVVYDAISTPIAPDNNTPYACYADVTSLLASLPSLTGTYTVADVLSSTGSNGSTGLSAGWTLFVVYEDPSLNMKSFNVFDGFSHIYKGHTETIPVAGFRTPPSGGVDLQFAYAALDGDRPQGGTKLEFETKQVVTPLRPANEFFNSSIENFNGVSSPRNPSGSNTLGYDTGMLEVKGADPEYIDHNQTTTSFTLQVAPGQADPVFAFFGAYAVDIIAPDIKLTKLVRSSTGTDIGGTNVTLGDYLYYEINYQNLGNDNVTGMTIKDVLPKNIIFNYPADLDLTNAGGVTVQSYDPITKTIIFKVPDASVIVGKPAAFTIRIKAQVVPDCNMLTDACSNEIKNQAVATYKGVINTNTFSSDSFSSTGCDFGSATPTNFLVKIDNCKFTKKVVLCNNSVILTAPNGYDSYVWSKTLGGSSIGTGPTYTATQTGTYYVHATSLTTCLPIDQEITVVPFGNTVSNPVIPYAQAPYAGSVTTCTINGKLLPNLFLCGANDFRDIKTGITDATSIIWEKLNENGTCLAATSTTVCANENASCSWSQVGTGPDYKANTAGQFRLTINYTGGCFSVFYFNVFQNLLNPTVVSKDITCNTTGQITVNGIPASGYEYSLDNGGTGTYQASNIFNNVSAGLHNVYIREVGVTNACLFKVLNVQILNRIYQVSVNVKQPLCDGGKGSVILQANNVLPQYYFSISQGATQVNAAGPLNANDFTFSNLNPGTYTVRVWTDDGCDYSQNIDIINPPQLTATATLTKPLTCTDGEITIYPVGGTAPYIYYINSTTNFQNNPKVAVTNPLPAGGIYNITVEDSNNCRATTSATAAATPAPVFAIQTTNVLCYGDASGVIQFNVTSNAGGYTLSYSIDGGTTYSNNPVFSNLVANTVYAPMIRFTLDGVNYCYDTKPTVTLTGPSSAVTASAGVSELAGCSLSGQGGKLRITNPQGGVAPYLYSFDNQATWVTTNEADMLPGTYTLYIKDANGCIYPMPNVVLDPKPVAPTIAVASPVYNCDGTANTTATITNPGSANYQYGYLLDGAVNTNSPPNVFVNIPSGSHTVSVTYNLVSVPTYSNLLNEDFGSGSPTTTSGIASAYCFNDQHVASPWACGTRSVEDNQYSVASFFWRSDDTSSSPAWYHYKDHTSNGTNSNGRYLLVNIGSAAGNYGVLYSKPIVDVIPNQPVKVDLYLGNLLRSYMTNADCDFIIELVDPAGVVVASQSTGIIPKNEKWNLKSLSLNPGPNTSLTFKIRSGSIAYNGNDAVIDDIRVYQLPKSCITQVDFPFVVPTGKAFSGSVTGFKDITCAGANNGEFTIAVQNFDPAYGFDYSINGGSTWVHKTASPVTITGLAANTYTPLLRYNAAGACPLTLTPVTIKAPTALTVNASVTTLPTCTTGATITASAGGGTPAYEFELRNTTGGAVVQPYQTNTQFNNVAAGNYTVFAKDANGCITSVGAAVNVVAPPTLTASLDPSASLCYDGITKVKLTVNVTGGTAPFSYSISPNVAPVGNTFDVLPGTYIITVTDAKSCTSTISNIIIAPVLKAIVNSVGELSCSAPKDATIAVAVSGGTAPYNYTVNGVAAASPLLTAGTISYDATTAGDYTFVITDAKNCTVTTKATVATISNPTVTANPTNVSCNLGTDGQVQLIGNGGSGGYIYTFNKLGGPVISTTTPGLYKNLLAGTYEFTVTDSKGCVSSPKGTIVITEPTALLVSASATSLSCSPTNTKQSAVVTINVPTTGTAPYQYSFNGGGYTNTNTLTVNDNGTDQTIKYSVKDANGCIQAGTDIIIYKLNPPVISSITGTAINCAPAATSSTVTVKTTAGTGVGTLTYQITAPVASATNTTGVFTGLSAGTYTFKVIDTNGCYAIDFYTVKPLVNIAVTASKLSDVDCYGSSTGAIHYDVSGFATTSTYSYSVNGATPVTGQTAASFNLTGLPKGTYLVVFTDETTLCTSSTSVIIDEPTAALSANATVVNANCFTQTAKVTVTPVVGSGTSPYTYAYKQDGVAPILIDYVSVNVKNLDPSINKNWDVWVKDAKGCTFKIDVVIDTDTAPTVIASAINQCLGVGSYTITATVTGGKAPLSYSINGGSSYQPTNTFVVTAAGDYTIKVKDANGCTWDSNVITVAPKLTLTAVLNKNITCEVGNEDAKITLTAVGGSGTYSYASNPTTGSFSGNVFTPTAAGNYTFTITDTTGNLCSASTTTAIAITAKVDPVITSITQTEFIKCNGDQTAAIHAVIDPSKGQAPYQYSIDNGVTFQSSPDFTGLGEGDYTIIIKDAKQCTGSNTIHIDGKAKIDFNLTKVGITCSSPVGSITVESVTGGTAPFTYTISNNYGDAIPAYTTLPNGDISYVINKFGIYTVTVTDANGCSLTKYIPMTSPPDDLKINIALGQPDCISGGNATVTVGVAVPGNKYKFGIMDSNTVPYSSNLVSPNNGTLSHNFTGLTPGLTYSFVVYDEDTLCYYINTADMPIPASSGLTAALTPNNVSCLIPGNDGSVTMKVTGYSSTATSVDYQVYNAQTNASIGTVQTETFATLPPPIDFTATTPSSLIAGQYYVLLVEHGGSKNGCKTAIPFEIKKSARQLDLAVNVLKDANCNPKSGVITVQPLYGTGPYEYKLVGITNPAIDSGWLTTNSFNADAGDYTAYVKDAYGCSVNSAVTLKEDDAPTVAPPLTSICYDGSSPFTITFSGTVDASLTGTETYSVNGSAFQSTPSFTFNAADTYNLVIKDGNGCTANINYIVYPKLELSAELTKVLDCTLSPDAKITLTSTGGNTTLPAVYTYEVSTDAGGTWSPMATNVYPAALAGTYYFKVKNAYNGVVCEVTTSIVLDPIPPTVLATPITTNITCNGDSNGTIFVEVTSGEGPYKFSLDNGVTEQTDNTFTGLPAGNYVVTVRNARLCKVNTASITITEPLKLTATATAPPYSCNANNVPQTVVTVNIDNIAGVLTGTGPYKYKFDPSPTAPYYDANTLLVNDNGSTLPQTIHYYVIDANGCTYDSTVDVAPYKKITDLTFTVLPITCANPTRDVKVTVVGGYTPIAKYEIVLPNPLDNGSSDTFAGLGAGTYLIKVTDVNGCSFEKTLKIDDVTRITVSGQVTKDVTCNEATPVTNGAVEFTVDNNAGGFTVIMLQGSGTPVVSGNKVTLSNVGIGIYEIEVTDAITNCKATAQVEVKQPTLSLSVIPHLDVNANCHFGAQVSSVATGGTPNYTYAYALSTSPAPVATDYSSNASAVLDVTLGLNWTVYVKDANACETQAPLTLAIDPLPAVTKVDFSNCASVAGTYTITVVATGVSALEYNIGSGYQASNVFTVTTPGNYTVLVRDANKCVSATAFPFTILDPLQVQGVVTTLPTCNSADGVVTLTAIGGSASANYRYKLESTGTYTTSNTFSGLAPGSHTFYVQDIGTTDMCEAQVTVIIPTATPITNFAVFPTPVTCNGGNDGTITATMATPAPGVNDNPVYTYVLNGMTLGGVTVTRPSQSSPIFSGLAAGNYTVVVTSGRGCTDTKTIPVTEPGIITVPTPTPVQFGCTSGSNATNFATITVSPSGGSGTYSIYEFFKGGVSVQRGSSNVYTETDLAGGSYTVTVYDDKGCSGSASGTITIAPFISLDKINIVINKAITCNNPEDITVTVATTGGTPAVLNYTVAGTAGNPYNQSNNNGIFTGLPVGNYIITVTNPATGCSIQDVHYVNEPNTFDLTIDNIVDVTCFGGTNGSANVTIVDRTMPDQAGPFSYTLVAPNGTTTNGNSATAGPLTLNGLAAGTYIITATLTNSPYCSVSKVFTISQPTAALKISETHTPITCAGNDGTISATATGGWPGGYDFALAGPVNVAYSSQSNFSNLTAGLYTVSVRDSKGCEDQVQVNLVNPTPIAATIIVDKPMLACFGDTNATITVQQPVGGSGVYKYTLEATYPNGTITLNGPQSSNMFTNLGAGSYKVIVSDTWSCSVNTNTVVIKQPTVVTANLVKTLAQTCLSPASLTLSAAGGTGPYRYSTDPNFTNPSSVSVPFASTIIINVPFTTVPANYVYYVRDANGCSNAVSNSIDVIPLEQLDFTFENNNPYINCLGDNDGEITASAKGGSGNYVYTLLDGSGNALPAAPTQLTPGHFTQLPAGNYTVMVTSGDCTLRKTITITQPNSALTYTAAVTNVTCNGNGDGKVVLTGSGGTGVIKYAISPDLDKFLDNGTFLNLVVGHYQAIIQDVNGCNHVYDFDITEPAPITAIVDPLSIKQELCSGEKTGEFAITVAGGTAPYSTSIDGDTFVPNRVSFTGLSGGKHTVIIKDANLCEFTFDELLNPAVTLDPVASISNDCVNNAPANKVTVHIDDSNNPADVTYSLDSTGTPQSSNVFTNLAPGNHFVMVQHKNGCVDATLPFVIDQVDPLTISINLGGLNEIVATVTGGSGVYQFTVNGESIGSNNKYIYFHSGDYTVTVTDSYGCSVSATKYFEFIDITIPPIFTPNGDGSNDNWKPTNTENYPDIKFIVYDRYGRQVGVFGAGQSWDGKYNGTELPMGDYWYILKLRHAQDDREFVGHFTLYR